MRLLDHTHGVANTACSHPDCRASATRYRKQWGYDRLQGKTRLVDAEQARVHIATLVGRGWSLRAIAGAAGVGQGTPHHLAKGQQRAHPDVIKKILAVEPNTVPSIPSHQTTEPFVPRVGVVRRIQALMTLGWTHAAMTRHSGARTAVLLAQQGRWVTRSTHDKVAAMYRDLCTRPGPSLRTRSRAVARGYHGPLAWDDIDHDPEPETWEDTPDRYDPTLYDEAVVIRVVEGHGKPRRLTRPECIEIYRRLRARGASTWELEHLYKLKPERYRDTDLDGDAA